MGEMSMKKNHIAVYVYYRYLYIDFYILPCTTKAFLESAALWGCGHTGSFFILVVSFLISGSDDLLCTYKGDNYTSRFHCPVVHLNPVIKLQKLSQQLQLKEQKRHAPGFELL